MERMKDADLFVNITNDAWFGDTQAPHQHAMLATVQAAQYGRPLLRIGYTGVGMVVEPHGVIKGETQPFTEVSKTEEIRMAQISTLYRHIGWPRDRIAVTVGTAYSAGKGQRTECIHQMS